MQEHNLFKVKNIQETDNYLNKGEKYAEPQLIST